MLVVLLSIFWGLLLLSILVVAHEGGHFLAARICGMRVTEYFLGMPFRFRLAYKSKRYGTTFGATPIFLGGYTRICGMENIGDEHKGDVLAYIYEHGSASVKEIASALSLDADSVINNVSELKDWASIELKSSNPDNALEDVYQTCKRDALMRTEYDKDHDFSDGKTTQAGQKRPLDRPLEFLAKERAQTYAGKGFLKRVFVLLAGPLVNIILAFIIVCSTIMISGVTVIENSNVIAGVEKNSLAQKAGLKSQDQIIEVSGVLCSDWEELSHQIQSELADSEELHLTFIRDNQRQTITISIPDNKEVQALGIRAHTSIYHPTFFEAAQSALSYGAAVAQFAVRLIMPQHTMEVIGQSSSVVGISVMAQQAAQSGIKDLLLLAAAISMSLGFMNLLPIPPLDGGKILIECIQALTRKTLSLRVQAIVSYIGIAFFLLIFVLALRNDIVNFILG